MHETFSLHMGTSWNSWGLSGKYREFVCYIWGHSGTYGEFLVHMRTIWYGLGLSDTDGIFLIKIDIF